MGKIKETYLNNTEYDMDYYELYPEMMEKYDEENQNNE